MPAARFPNNWNRIERNIKLRADFRCECGTMYDCDSGAHYHRCPNTEGNRYVHNKRLIKLRVVQVKRGPDWRPSNLVGLCLPCYQHWEADELAVINAQINQAQAGLF